MQLRVTRHEETALVAVTTGQTGAAMPGEVRLVDEAVADAVEQLVTEAGDVVGEVDLDVVIAVASARARA